MLDLVLGGPVVVRRTVAFSRVDGRRGRLEGAVVVWRRGARVGAVAGALDALLASYASREMALVGGDSLPVVEAAAFGGAARVEALMVGAGSSSSLAAALDCLLWDLQAAGVAIGSRRSGAPRRRLGRLVEEWSWRCLWRVAVVRG
jgi:hypothetical protein